MALTLDQMAQIICTSKLLQFDAASVAAAYAFLNFRYRMVWECYPWRDSQIIPSDVVTVASQSYVVLPAGIDRVISIRCNLAMLEPTNSTLQIETNPTYFDAGFSGTPLYYEEYTEVSDNSKRIRLFPVPNAIFALKIIAKRTPNSLTSASDTPILRNIDNVLIAYAQGDMLERARVYAKAKQKYEEAGALLEVAKQLESAQTNAPRTTKNISVTGDSLLEMIDAVCARCGTWSQEHRILVKDFIRRNYRRVHDANLWKDTLSKTTANTVNAQGFISMPSGLQRVVSISLGDTMLEPVNSMTLMQTDPGIFATSSTPKFFEEYDDGGVKKIRLLPTPNAVVALNIVGKKAVDALVADTDIIAIRNVANVIIDAACAEMFGLLEKPAQAEKYSASSQNGLKGAIDLEAQQTFFARTAKPLTVTGDSLGEMVDAVCARCAAWTQQDRILAKDFVRRNYRRIHDSHLWNDTVDNTTANTVNAQNYIAMPTGYQRVISIGIVASSVMLEPVDSATLVQTDPTIFTRTGVPQFFEEYDSAGSKRIRLLPIPNAVYVLTIVGKKTIDTLANDADIIPIRGVANVIIDASCADMLSSTDKARADTFSASAQSGLKVAIDLEERQTFLARTAKPLTVTGDSLGEMTDAACARCGAWSQEKRILVKDFIRRKYRNVHDSHLWKDTVDNTTASTVSAQNYIPMPTGYQRVISIGIVANNQMLEPVDSATLVQTDPTIFTRTGIPQFFEEYDTAGVKRIRLLPIPNAIYALTIVGKKNIDTLANDADIIPIRGVANAIIDAACSELFSSTGDKERAAAFAASSQNELKTAIELEEQQTFRARMAKPLTVSGDSLAEMADAVCSKVGIWTQAAVISAKEFLRRNYQMLWDSELWPESVVAAKVNSDGAQIVLPEYFERVLSVRPNSDAAYELTPFDVPLYLQMNPQIFEDDGEAVAYSTLTAVAVHSLPPTNEKLIFVSTSALDKSSIRLMGETLGTEVSETITLNGTSAVVSANTYDTPLTIAKGITTGTIHVTGQTSGIALQMLPPMERERKHLRLWLQPSPGVSEQALVIGKRKIKPLVSDEDTPMLRKAANALISSAVADLLESLNKDSKSARERAAAALQIIKDGELRQNARQPRVVPSVEYCFSPDDSFADSWFVAK